MAGAVNLDAERERMPEPLRERPPDDRYCDLVLTGGVASGVVYPWAIVELARAFNLRNIGGTSVGAMAAALAAACEYGRRNGHPHAYEVMRRLPASLAGRVEDPVDGVARTRMVTLFQPAHAGRRLFGLLLDGLDLFYRNPGSGAEPRAGEDLGDASAGAGPTDTLTGEPTAAIARRGGLYRLLWRIAGAYGLGILLGWALGAVIAGVVALLLWGLVQGTSLQPRMSGLLSWLLHGGFVIAVGTLVAAAMRLLCGLARDLRQGLLEHDLGFCKGASVPAADGKAVPGLVEWLDEGIQRAAGLPLDGPPLTFEELWHAPLRPGGPRPDRGRDGLPTERSINLEMITTNVTHGRPYRLPLADPDARLLFRRSDWQGYLPERVLDALCRAAEPYRPKSGSDPSYPRDRDGQPVDDLLELPGARMPIVVAARLSLSYPLLFSAPPLWAVDHEVEAVEKRPLRRCRLSDGGLCSNFPVHFFDSALPRWPTFGIWLERRSPLRPDQAVWLPQYQGQGRGDRWQHFEPGDAPRPGFATLLGFLWSGFVSAKDWRDHTSLRMPHVRRRVVRVMLRREEGELNVGMPASTIMRMAAVYGTGAGVALCKAYAPAIGADGPTRAWREHLWDRFDVLLEGLAGLFRRFGEAANSGGHTLELRRLLLQARNIPVVERLSDKRRLREDQADALVALVDALEALELSLRARPAVPHGARPAPELRLRPPL